MGRSGPLWRGTLDACPIRDRSRWMRGAGDTARRGACRRPGDRRGAMITGRGGSRGGEGRQGRARLQRGGGTEVSSGDQYA